MQMVCEFSVLRQFGLIDAYECHSCEEVVSAEGRDEPQASLLVDRTLSFGEYLPGWVADGYGSFFVSFGRSYGQYEDMYKPISPSSGVSCGPRVRRRSIPCAMQNLWSCNGASQGHTGDIHSVTMLHTLGNLSFMTDHWRACTDFLCLP